MGFIPSEPTFIKVPQDLQDKLCQTRIPGEARQVLDLIIRKTLGWGKESDEISLSQFNLKTGLKKVAIIKARNKLVEMNIIRVTKKGNDDALNYSINLDFASWDPLPKKVTLPKKVMSVTQLGNKSLPKILPTIDTSTKDTITKDMSPLREDPPLEKVQKEFSPEVLELAELLISQILKNHPTNQISRPDKLASARRQWPLHIERLMRVDNKSPPEIHEMILWATEHDFWSANILSAGKLREKWDDLHAQKNRRSNGKGFKSSQTPQAAGGQQDRLQGLREFASETEARPGDIPLGPGDFSSAASEPPVAGGQGKTQLFAFERFDSRAVHEGGFEVLPDPQGGLSEYESSGLYS
jgi:phage replication O-like protein O